ncbi:MAG: hypothetical protein RR253_00610 [Oscillospiraceae bacterium]
MKKIIPLFMAMCLLCGCGAISNRSNIIDLLSSPKLSGRESQVVSAIKSYLGEDIILKYPKQGSNISPVQISDFSGDGSEEAVVLYSAPNSGGNVRIAILSQEGEDKWSVFFDAEGFGTEVYKVEFSPLIKGKNRQMVVGYTFANSSEKFMSIYFVEEGKVENVKTESCQDFMLHDVTGDGVSDVVLAGVNADDRRTGIQVLSSHYNSVISDIADYTIQASNATVTGISFSKNDFSPLPAIVVDYKDTYRRVYTEGFYFENYSLKSIMSSDTVQKIWDYSYNLTSIDVDKDGYVETPTVIIDPDAQSSPLKFMEWTSYMTSQPKRVAFGVGDGANGVFVAMPEEWQNYVKTQVDKDGAGWKIIQSLNGTELVTFQLAIPGEKTDATADKAVISIGTLQIKLIFDESVSQQQRDYISHNVIYIK